MKYVILIHSNPRTRQVFERMTADQQLQFARDHRDFGQTLLDSGELIHAEGLLDVTEAKWVTVADGEIMATDGPYGQHRPVDRPVGEC
jgi:hypothetical protein